MVFVADKNGVVRVPFAFGETAGSFGLNGMDGEPFAPGATIEIDDARLATVAAQLLAPMGATDVSIGVEPASDGD